MSGTAEYIVHKVYDNERTRGKIRQGSEVARITASTYKWGPGNAIEAFAKSKNPPPGLYLVTGPGTGGKQVFSVYDVKYPAFTIEGTRSGGIQLYGERESEETEATA